MGVQMVRGIMGAWGEGVLKVYAPAFVFSKILRARAGAFSGKGNLCVIM